MAEKALLAYFSTEEAARRAYDQLKSMGIEEVQRDQIGAYPQGGDTAKDYFNLLTGGEKQSLTALVQGLESSEDTNVLMASSPVSYSMADGSSFISGENHLVTVVCDENQEDQARSILRNLGGNI